MSKKPSKVNFDETEERYNYYDPTDDYNDDYDDGFPDTILGCAGTMYHVGGGLYCDDDGDNWDVF